jgi:hypothetical protein
MMQLRSDSGRSVRVALALALASSCVPGVHSPDGTTGTGPINQNTGGGIGTEPGPPRPTGPPPNFGPAKNSAKPARPVIGGTLAVLADARTAVAADPDRDRIFVTDYRQKKVLAEIALQPGDEPGRVVADGEGRVHVALRGGGAVVTLVPGPWRIAGRRDVCSGPRGLAYDADQRQVHVACADGDLVSLPVEPEAGPVRRLTLDRDLRDVVVDGSVLLVSRFRSAEVLTVDRDGKILARQTPSPRRTFRPKAAVNEGNTASPASDVPPSLMTASVGWKMIGLQTGQALLLHQRGLSDEVSETTPGGYGGEECGGIVETVISRVGALAGDLPAPTIPTGPVAVDLALSPDHRTLAIVSPGQAKVAAGGVNFPPGFGGGGQVVAIDVDSLNQQAGECNPTGVGGRSGGGFAGAAGGSGGDGGSGGSDQPADGGVDDGGMTADASPPDDLPPPTIDFRQPTGETVAVAYDVKGHLLVQTREPATIQVLTANNDVILSYDSRADTGHDIFHSNAGAGIACASCHPEGGDDGRVWKFRNKKGVLEDRRTQNLRGGVLATAPFHWNGDLANVGAVMSEVFVHRMNGPQLGADYVGALSKWLDTIPAMPRPPVRDMSAATRGAALFASPQTKCVTCHTGALMTNNTNTDVGTGRAFQVPSLRGVGWRAPFMHNGCAATMADRFDPKCGGGDKHGVTSKLTPAQISDLSAFLETL